MKFRFHVGGHAHRELNTLPQDGPGYFEWLEAQRNEMLLAELRRGQETESRREQRLDWRADAEHEEPIL